MQASTMRNTDAATLPPDQKGPNPPSTLHSFETILVVIFLYLILSYFLTNSSRILQSDGWCHSAFVFISGLVYLLIKTPFLTCLLMLSLLRWVTLALNFSSSPSWNISMSFFMKDSSSLLAYICSFDFVYEPVTKGRCWTLKKSKCLKLYNFSITSR